MILPTVQALAHRVPPLTPPPALAAVPEFAPATPLAQALGTTAARLLSLAGELGAQRSGIVETAAGAEATIAAARGRALELMRRYLVAVAALLPRLALQDGNAQAELARISAEHLAQSEEQAAELRAELAPAAAALDRIAAEPGHNPYAHAPAPAASAPDNADEATNGTQPAAVASQSPGPEPAPAGSSAAVAASPEGSASGQKAAEAALSAVGTPYQWGGNVPGQGLDCSGLTHWAYQQAGVDIPRVADQQATGQQVSQDQLQPGDLAVWDGHVAMYVGNGQIVEAGDPVQTGPVRTSNMGMQFLGFYRPTA